MVTKTEFASELKTLRSEMVTKTGLAAELETLRSEMCTKEDFKFLFDELMKVETWTGKIERRVDDLSGKVDTLLLQSDNSMMILELYNQNSAEINNLKYRVDKIERKMA